MSRFAFLQSDSEGSDTETERAPVIAQKEATIAQVLQQPIAFAEDVDVSEFHAVPKKKAVKGGNAEVAIVDSPPTPSTMNMKERVLMVKKKKKAANNRFACFADTDEESEYETDHEEEAAPVVQYQPLAKQTTSGANHPDYFAIVHLETTSKPERDAVEEIKKPFKPEVISLQLLFVNSKTKKCDHEFKKLIRPSDFPVLTTKTTELTSITNADLERQQPLDEVLRELDRFLKDKNLTAANRNKKRPQSSLSSTLSEFQLVAFGGSLLQHEFKQETARKSIQPKAFFSKWIDLKKVFLEHYKKDAATLGEMMHKICMEYEGVAPGDDGKNLMKLFTAVLADIPFALQNTNAGWK
eukprot:g9408.t1